MKREDVIVKGPELKNVTGFHYVKGNICRLDPPSYEEEHWEKKKETFDRTKAGACLRCGELLEETAKACRVCGKLKKLTT